MKKQKSKQRGITLIALIVTIIVLLILAGVTIASLTGEGGILNKATKAKKQTTEEQAQEELQLAIMALNISYYEEGKTGNFRDYIFDNEEKLKKELGNKNIQLNQEAKTITNGGIVFSVDEEGKIEKVEGIALSDVKKTIRIVDGVGEETNLTATLVTIEGDITWKNSNEEVVRITGNGNTITLTGITDGTAVITASCQGEEATCEVTVKTVIVATTLTVEPTKITINEKETAEITAIQNGTEEIEWESSDPSVASVVVTGEENKIAKITGLTPGTVTITARTQGQTATCIVSVAAESILDAISKMCTGGIKQIVVKGKTDTIAEDVVEYSMNVIYCNGNLTLDGNNTVEGATLNNKIYSFGSNSDIGTESKNAKNTVVLKVEGDLTINEQVTLTSVTGSYGGPKGLIIYCTGNLINNGTISMSGRGAKATGENVYLWKNANGSFEYIPATGGTGGAGAKKESSVYGADGQASGLLRSTAGGGGAASCAGDTAAHLYAKSGGNGNSYGSRLRRGCVL